jgi:MoaA/NifB/PqqE/SkfB family radical SAM enzyme
MLQGMATVMSRDTLDEIRDILDLAEEIGIMRVIFFNFVPAGNAKEIKNCDLTPSERDDFMKILYHEMTHRKIEVLSTSSPVRKNLSSSG